MIAGDGWGTKALPPFFTVLSGMGKTIEGRRMADWSACVPLATPVTAWEVEKWNYCACERIYTLTEFKY
jgi:hypothetical protein